jgi:protein-S-isoprenylcysteine O-methyltransferase Ste14
MVAPEVTATLVLWAVFELVLRVTEVVRRQGRTTSDRGTRVLIAVSLGAAVAGGFWLAAVIDPGSPWRLRAAAVATGVVVMVTGLVLRIWAVLTLGRSFRTTVEVHRDQRVVDTGPYRSVRHPSYTGLLLVVLGFEIGTRVWPAVLLVLLPCAAVVRRIAVEEAFLLAALGPSYAAYRGRTRRLVPGVW